MGLFCITWSQLFTFRCLFHIPELSSKIHHIRKPGFYRVGKEVEQSCLLICRLGGTQLQKVREREKVEAFLKKPESSRG